ncbi:MAG: FAD:protein FMN transferase [Oscillospiraceae bacterium]|nr:FAD:protein FMN transferase [Oscillospiraceae bacterium]
MRRILPILLALCLILCGCSSPQKTEPKQYTATFLNLFDTLTTIVGKAENKETFEVQAQQIHDALLIYHQLFDIYNDYDGINNLKTINDNAGKTPVTVDPIIIRLLKECKTYYELSGGRVNVAMGSVLSLWHEARNDGIQNPALAKLPEVSTLKSAAEHISPDCIMIDETASTVYLSDADARLDVGAVAKGWAVQRVAETISEGLLISVGGNVCTTGPKAADGSPWVIGIQDPNQQDKNLHTIFVSGGAVVTSGDYQRSYQVNGTSYHHIIDPETLMPSTYWKSVTVVCEDSGLADALSTTLFLLPLAEGQQLLKQCGAEALWIDSSGAEFMSTGFEKILRT